MLWFGTPAELIRRWSLYSWQVTELVIDFTIVPVVAQIYADPSFDGMALAFNVHPISVGCAPGHKSPRSTQDRENAEGKRATSAMQRRTAVAMIGRWNLGEVLKRPGEEQEDGIVLSWWKFTTGVPSSSDVAFGRRLKVEFSMEVALRAALRLLSGRRRCRGDEWRNDLMASVWRKAIHCWWWWQISHNKNRQYEINHTTLTPILFGFATI